MYNNQFLGPKIVSLLEPNRFFAVNLMNLKKLLGTKLIWLPNDTIKKKTNIMMELMPYNTRESTQIIIIKKGYKKKERNGGELVVLYNLVQQLQGSLVRLKTISPNRDILQIGQAKKTAPSSYTITRSTRLHMTTQIEAVWTRWGLYVQPLSELHATYLRDTCSPYLDCQVQTKPFFFLYCR